MTADDFLKYREVDDEPAESPTVNSDIEWDDDEQMDEPLYKRDDIRSRLITAYDPANTQPLYSSIVDSIYSPRIESDDSLKKRSGLNAAIGALADAFSSSVERSASNAPIYRRNVHASQLANRAMEEAKRYNDILKDRYGAAKMQALGQDLSAGMRAYNLSQNSIAKYLADKRAEDNLKYKRGKDEAVAARWKADHALKEKGHALKERGLALRDKERQANNQYRERRLAMSEERNRSLSEARGGGSKTVRYAMSLGNGEERTIEVPKLDAQNVNRSLIAIGKEKVRKSLERNGSGKYMAAKELKGYSDEDFFNIALGTQEGLDLVSRYSVGQSVAQPSKEKRQQEVETQEVKQQEEKPKEVKPKEEKHQPKAEPQPKEKKEEKKTDMDAYHEYVKDLLTRFPNLTKGQLVKAAHAEGVPQVIDIGSVIDLYKK